MTKKGKQRVAAAQRRNLEGWLHDWNLERLLQQDEEADQGDVSRRAESAMTGRPAKGAVVEVRQIRLLYPDCNASWQRPVYLALLEERGSDGILAAPFSRFANPALPGEFLTGRAAPQLRVLSLWCARVFKTARMVSGWQVDELSEIELDQAFSVYEWIHKRCQVPVAIRERVGPPLIHPLDPRWDYREEELEFMESLQPAKDPDVQKLEYEIKELPVEYRSKAADSPDHSEGH